MANNVELITWQNMDVTPVDDALVYETAIGAGGIIYGCEVTIKNSNTLHINAGHAIICGRKMTVVEDDIAITLATAGVQKGRLYMQLDLSNASTPAQLITEVSGALTPPIQDENVNITNGTFEINLYIFDVSPTEISNLVRVANPLANILGNFAKIETRMVATKDYDPGECFVKDNQMFKALAAINSGDLFAIGGNCKKTTVGEEIEALINEVSTNFSKQPRLVASEYIAQAGSRTYQLQVNKAYLMITMGWVPDSVNGVGMATIAMGASASVVGVIKASTATLTLSHVNKTATLTTTLSHISVYIYELG